jgi:hypothetical protein
MPPLIVECRQQQHVKSGCITQVIKHKSINYPRPQFAEGKRSTTIVQVSQRLKFLLLRTHVKHMQRKYGMMYPLRHQRKHGMMYFMCHHSTIHIHLCMPKALPSTPTAHAHR